MQISQELQEFIEEHVDLIEANTPESWKQIYSKLYKNKSITSEFTKTMLDVCGVDPAEFLGYVPSCYLRDQDIPNYTIPDSVKYIESFAFKNSTIIEAIIPEGVEEIDESVFSNCQQLNYVSIPSTLESVNCETFAGCSNLQQVDISNGIMTIGQLAFQGCSSLTQLHTPDSVECIGWYAFKDCKNISKVSLPSNITDVGGGLFYECTKLTEIEFRGTKEQYSVCILSKKSASSWKVGSKIKQIICTDGVIEL